MALPGFHRPSPCTPLVACHNQVSHYTVAVHKVSQSRTPHLQSAAASALSITSRVIRFGRLPTVRSLLVSSIQLPSLLLTQTSLCLYSPRCVSRHSARTPLQALVHSTSWLISTVLRSLYPLLVFVPLAFVSVARLPVARYLEPVYIAPVSLTSCSKRSSSHYPLLCLSALRLCQFDSLLSSLSFPLIHHASERERCREAGAAGDVRRAHSQR